MNKMHTDLLITPIKLYVTRTIRLVCSKYCFWLRRGYNISSKLSSDRLSLFGWSVHCWMVSALARTLQLVTDRPNNMFCLENKWYHYYKFANNKMTAFTSHDLRQNQSKWSYSIYDFSYHSANRPIANYGRVGYLSGTPSNEVNIVVFNWSHNLDIIQPMQTRC